MLLNLHSYYSLRFGTLGLADLVQGMLSNGYDTAVLTDINNSSGVLDFIRMGWDAGLNVLPGMEYRNGDRLLYIGIARNGNGFRELNEHMSSANLRGRPLPEVAPEFSDAFVVYPFGARLVTDLRDNEYIGIRPSEATRLVREPKVNLERYVILAPVTHAGDDYRLHCQLRAIDNNILLSQLEQAQAATRDEGFVPRAKLLETFKPFPQLIRNTNRLLSECRFDFNFMEVKNKRTFTGNRDDDRQLLFRYTKDGFTKRYGTDRTAWERAERELSVIDKLDFASYFLITDDICRYARLKGFHYVGRGSGANSLVAYCLGITDVCPLQLNLPFERFLNPKRKTPPDFDVDFSWAERDEMYAYIFPRYRNGHVALMGAMSTFKDRSTIRELGKVYGLPKAEIDRLINEPGNPLNSNRVTKLILSSFARLSGADFPNQRTIHSSGVLISESPLTSFCALDLPPKGLPTTQMDMYTAEDIGFEKFDILSQRGIGHIKDCREVVRNNTGEFIDTSNPRRFFSDPQIAERLKKGDTIGCFYIESPAMRQLLIKLVCDNYLTLVAASSIIRPGVASSGMMGEYIKRHRDPSTVTYPHPVFREQLEETYGVMVYQEDVMKIANAYGGLDMADADVLRRMMSGKYRSKEHLVEIKDKYFDNCRKQGYPVEVSQEIWRQMESFAGYSFNKAHSASFAVESYQSLFLKTYYPKEFMVAVLNNYGGFYQRKVYVNEARKAGADVCLPCINRSVYNTTIYGSEIFLGFDCLLNLEKKLAEIIPRERRQNGDYTSLENFAMRTGTRLEQLIILIRIGAFRCMGIGKKELLWEAHVLLSGQKSQHADRQLLFHTESAKPVLPKLTDSLVEDLYDEMELIGFGVSGTLFDLAESEYRALPLAKDLPNLSGKTVWIAGDLVAEKFVRTKNGEMMKFGTFLDSQGDFFDTVHFPKFLQAYPLRGAGIYIVEGTVTLEFGVPSVAVTKCQRMTLKPDPRSPE
ncbi:DNA polymerase III subunit alpha [Parapedobacter sp. ISTM3]|uniref:DNA polymerase III subunit alpha n=1 Tax=Parapedobacter sp. ISTM3 TaxID=2800130 RepID=UPI0019060418|nr:DNA polymerase III subunit alpha [Parapedobacter sp. ISTM3]MBK1439818.1 DNA polymerase III subunit alpha [Parapedobacter sp. ISTM3]